MARRRAALAALSLAAIGATMLVAPSAQAALPTGTLVSPASGSTHAAGSTMQLRTNATDTSGATGPTAGVRQVEWWLYADKNQGAPTDFSDQYPNNAEDKIQIGMSTVPASGTPADGTWEATWQVPTDGVVNATYDGDHTTPIPSGTTRRYVVPSGTYRVQSHLIDDEWRANPGTPGMTAFNTITLNTGSTATPTPTPTTPPPAGSCDGWAGQYYNGMSLGGTPAATRCDPTVNFDWGQGAPIAGVSADRFSVRWTRTINFPAGTYRFTARADDGTRVFVDGAPVIDAWRDQGATTFTGDRTLTAGNHTVVIEHYDNTYDAVMQFSYAAVAGGTPTPTPTPTTPPAEGGTNLVANPTYATGSPIPSCWMEGSWGTHSRSASMSTTDVPAGSPTGTRSFAYTVTNYQSGDAKIMASDATGCAPNVSAGTAYTLALSYKSSVQTNAIPLFTRTATSGWEYWTTLRTLPAASSWTRVSAPLPPIPTGTQRLSFGLAAVGNGTVQSTAWSLTSGTTSEPPPVQEPPPAQDDPRATTGEWTQASFALPNRAIHSTLLRDGRLLLIAGSGNDEGNFQAGRFTSHVLNPTTGELTNIATPVDMFCAGHVTLPDGRVLIQGGTQGWWSPTRNFQGLRSSYIFDPATNAYTRTNDSLDGHWYPTLTKLENGNIWMAGGLNTVGQGSNLTEMFDSAGSRWMGQSEVPQTWTYWGEYPHMFLMADGRLFYTGAHTFGDQRPGSGSQIYNWRTAQFGDVPGLRDKDLRDHAGSVLLPPAQNQRFMIAGGGYIDRGAAPTNSVDLINLNEANPAWRAGPALPGPGRQYVNLTNLFDRTVLASNGATGNRTGDVSAASIFNPANDTWTTVPADPIGRNYHSTHLLLPDGRVVILGSNPIDGSVETRISIYSPPYLFKGTRPEVTAPTGATYGQQIALSVTGDVTSASLTSPMSSTHQMDTNARLVDLPITGTGGSRTATIPSNRALLPPGPYMLTVMDSKGAVSTAKWVNVR